MRYFELKAGRSRNMPRRRNSRSPACGAGEDLIDYGEFKIDWREQVYIDHITKRNRLRTGLLS